MVGNRVFINQIEALDHFAQTKEPISFYFFEDVFDAYNWREEPETDFFELLRQRAQQLRDTYSYLRIWYSGGADSHTALRVFIENQIPIDEIIMVRSSPTGDVQDLANSEINKVAIPYVASIQNQLRGTKVQVVDLGNAEFRTLYMELHPRHWSFLTFRPMNLPVIELVKPQLFDRSSGVCDLHGGDKPKVVRKKDGHFYAFYYDIQPGEHLHRRNLEQFYVSPDFPLVHIKQCHLLKNHLKKLLPSEASGVELQDFDSPLYAEIDKCCRYPLHQAYSLGKSKNLITLKGQLALAQAEKDAPEIFRAFSDHIALEGRHYPERFNGQDLMKGFKCTRTKEYDLGT